VDFLRHFRQVVILRTRPILPSLSKWIDDLPAEMVLSHRVGRPCGTHKRDEDELLYRLQPDSPNRPIKYGSSELGGCPGVCHSGAGPHLVTPLHTQFGRPPADYPPSPYRTCARS
jgi:hypothetical protein